MRWQTQKRAGSDNNATLKATAALAPDASIRVGDCTQTVRCSMGG